jgi:hypothetical protein
MLEFLHVLPQLMALRRDAQEFIEVCAPKA